MGMRTKTIVAPLPDIAVHIVKPPSIRLFLADGVRAIRVALAAEPACFSQRSLIITRVENSRSPRPAGKLPLRLRGKTIPPAFFLTQLLAKRNRVTPHHLIHRQIISLESASTFAHHRSPLGLSHRVNPDEVTLRQSHLVLRFVPLPAHLRLRTPHHKRTRRDVGQFHPDGIGENLAKFVLTDRHRFYFARWVCRLQSSKPRNQQYQK